MLSACAKWHSLLSSGYDVMMCCMVGFAGANRRGITAVAGGRAMEGAQAAAVVVVVVEVAGVLVRHAACGE